MGRLTDADAEALQKDISPTLADLAETIGKKANATAVSVRRSSMATGR